MTNQNHTIEHSLNIPPKMWQEFRENMLNCRVLNEEVIGFFFCKAHHISKRKIRYIPKAWVVPSPDCYERQSVSGLVLTQQFHSYLLEKYLQEKLYIVHIHTHVGEMEPEFSSVDDYYESEYSQFLTKSFPQKPRLISGVFNQSLQRSQFRIWDRKGQNSHSVNFSHSYLQTSENTAQNSEKFVTEYSEKYIAICRKRQRFSTRGSANAIADSPQPNLIFARQQIFGDTCQKQLNELKVSLIGCGGIGAIFAELLGRLGVKNWVLIDPDYLEPVNLNRMPGATPKMAEQRWYKVDYVKYLIKKIYPTGSSVKAIPTVVNNPLAQAEIAASDLIIVATDNHLSRKQTQELALKYMRPLVCLGTHIEIDRSHNKPRMFCRITIPPLGGGWCLMCANIISLQKAAVESAPTEINRMVNKAGYIEGINDPAVFWLNSICASTGVGIIHGIVSGFLNVDAGIDWIYEFPNSLWHQTDVKHLENPDCYFCSLHGGENSHHNYSHLRSTPENQGFFQYSENNNIDDLELW
jgi:ThiF family